MLPIMEFKLFLTCFIYIYIYIYIYICLIVSLVNLEQSFWEIMYSTYKLLYRMIKAALLYYKFLFGQQAK